MSLLHRIATLIVYSQSSNKRQLDRYMKRIRNLQTLNEQEWEDFRVLAEHEMEVKRPKKTQIIHREPMSSFEKAKQKESFFYPNGQDKEPKME